MIPTQLSVKQVFSVQWSGNIHGNLELIDQTLLPMQLKVLSISTIVEAFEAIVMLRVRGAPAIGIAAAYGVVLGVQKCFRDGNSVAESRDAALHACDYLATSRPTAVNLFWALDRMRSVISRNPNVASAADIAQALLREARLIHDEDRRMCHAIGEHGARLLDDNSGVLTHCNTVSCEAIERSVRAAAGGGEWLQGNKHMTHVVGHWHAAASKGQHDSSINNSNLQHALYSSKAACRHRNRHGTLRGNEHDCFHWAAAELACRLGVLAATPC